MTRSPDIEYYLDYLPQPLLDELWATSEVVPEVPGLRVARGLRERFAAIETDEALEFTCELYRRNRDRLDAVLRQRRIDREFIDEATTRCAADNASVDFRSPEYRTVIGQVDANGRVVVGPIDRSAFQPSPVRRPPFIEGTQVTLFGPPDTAKLSINAMNAVHRKPATEPELVTTLVEQAGQVPRWGADNEDSKTPIMENFLYACENLIGCYDRTLQFVDEARNRTYRLADHDLSIPIKRIPGLALPDGNHLLDGSPLPLHLLDFALHMFHNWERPEALVFYVPKLENEEEAAYLCALIADAERALADMHPGYQIGTVRLFIVFENPRAIFRIQEIAHALEPYFLGGSLGWHDFLGSTARMFKNDPRYRIPVKADPNIVINHIRESHEILVRELEPLDAIKIGGMYGVLYEDGNQASYDVSMVGYIKDVVTQLRRGLDGFWVAHPDFVRPGIALVEAFRRSQADPDDSTLVDLASALVPAGPNLDELHAFIAAGDVPGLPEDDPRYLRGVLAADLEVSDVISNHDPEEVRYNVFQALQYLADWLCGNGCVALPATMTDASGAKVFVRIMDDLATTERSRWEVWAEVAHGRVPNDLFEEILQEEIAFIQAGRNSAEKRVEVRWEGEAARWYPIAIDILRQLMTSPQPPEFATELLMPFTLGPIRDAADPAAAARRLCPGKFASGA